MGRLLVVSGEGLRGSGEGCRGPGGVQGGVRLLPGEESPAAHVGSEREGLAGSSRNLSSLNVPHFLGL